MQLGQLQKIDAELLGLGFQIIAVSPDPAGRLKSSVQKNALSYSLLSDRAMEAARAFGLAYHISDTTAQALSRNGVDLATVPGETQALLPVPGVFLLRTDGEVAFSYVNPDYRVRLHPELLIAAARLESERK